MNLFFVSYQLSVREAELKNLGVQMNWIQVDTDLFLFDIFKMEYKSCVHESITLFFWAELQDTLLCPSGDNLCSRARGPEFYY